MTNRNSLFAVLMVGAVLLGGCASRNDLVASGRVAVEPRIDRNLRAPPEVYDDKGDLVVHGTVQMGASGGLAGHVDVTVVGPDGATLFCAQLNYRAKTTSTPPWTGAKHGVFRRAHRQSSSLGVYFVCFPGLPPEGSVIKVRHDPSPLAASTQSEARGNNAYRKSRAPSPPSYLFFGTNPEYGGRVETQSQLGKLFPIRRTRWN